MRVVIHLPHAVAAFQPTAAQIRALAARAPDHDILSAASEPAFLSALPEADAAVVWRFEAEWYGRAPRLRWLLTPSAGREAFTRDPRGRVTWCFGGFHGVLMAESLVAMISFMNRRLGDALVAQAARSWDRAPYSGCRRLKGQVVLILGYGAIGQRCGELLSALGMVVHAVRRDPSRPSPFAREVFSPERRLAALRQSDHVVCVLPGGTGTDRLIDAEALSHMKPGSVVYNLGRGNAIDAAALCRALIERRIAGAFLDVVPDEPLPESSPLWTAPNLFLTPHASAISAEYLDLYFEELAQTLSRLPQPSAD